ncbi:NADPH2:quinone reductase [Chryseomicrobium aureum]|uniref:NADPH:quinone oxidoreductase family protein n=1 Tax=Chryseomicrobium aureum TaxID=1441723 RepID=UPI00195622DA|nr:NADPH:quinone oxidoreductase family protein [Chryseomicrobium aureum]MBM7707172.1 NADPH2:quinone reductase [Chryseomicrobium aureum]
MKAWQIVQHGDPKDALRLATLERPKLERGQIRVKVNAAALNFFDILQCQGTYQEKHTFPFTPGAEIAGQIIEVTEASELSIGTFVIATPLLPNGGLSEEIVVHETEVFTIPDDFDLQKAAAMFITYQTAYYALHHLGNIEPNDVLLVHAGSGGVGSAAIQLGKAAGATVIATAGTDEKTQVCTQLGADYSINYQTTNFAEEVNKITQGKGADIIFDPVGGSTFDLSRKCIAFEGKILLIGFAGGKISDAPTNHVLIKNYSLVGVHWGYMRKKTPDRVGEIHNQLIQLVKEKKINPLIYRSYSFDEVVQALDELGDRKTYGKLIITI